MSSVRKRKETDSIPVFPRKNVRLTCSQQANQELLFVEKENDVDTRIEMLLLHQENRLRREFEQREMQLRLDFEQRLHEQRESTVNAMRELQEHVSRMINERTEAPNLSYIS